MDTSRKTRLGSRLNRHEMKARFQEEFNLLRERDDDDASNTDEKYYRGETRKQPGKTMTTATTTMRRNNGNGFDDGEARGRAINDVVSAASLWL